MANTTYQYSNGFDLKKVASAFTGRVGWKQPTLSGTPTLSADNLQSKSGRYFNDGSFHSLLTINNIKEIQENPKITEAQFNTLLADKVVAAMLRMLTGVFNEMEYYDRQKMLYERDPLNSVAVPNESMALGYQIIIPNKPNITAQILTATLLFDSDVVFNLYLFKDGKRLPVWQQSVTVVANEQTTVGLTDLFLNYANDYKGDKYYLVYFQSELGSAKAIQEQVDCWNKTCSLSCAPMQAPATGQTFDVNSIQYPMLPCGLNLEYYSFRDWTQDIIRRPALFDNLLGLTMAAMVIEESIYTGRSNATERNNKDELSTMGMQMDLMGAAPISGGPKITGLQSRITAEAARVKKEFTTKSLPKIVNLADRCCTQRQIR